MAKHTRMIGPKAWVFGFVLVVAFVAFWVWNARAASLGPEPLTCGNSHTFQNLTPDIVNTGLTPNPTRQSIYVCGFIFTNNSAAGATQTGSLKFVHGFNSSTGLCDLNRLDITQYIPLAASGSFGFVSPAAWYGLMPGESICIQTLGPSTTLQATLIYGTY